MSLKDECRLIQLIGTPLAIIDEKAIVKSYNKKFAHYFRLAESATEDFELPEIIPDCLQLQQILNSKELSILQEKEFTQSIKIGNIDEFKITYTVKALVEENPEYFLFEIVDLKEKTYGDINQKLFFFNKLMYELPLNIYFKDLQSQFLLVSKPMLKYFGLKSQEEALGKTDFDFFKPEHAQPAFDDEQNIIRTGKAKKLEEKEVWEDGRIAYVTTTKYPLIDARKKIIGTFGISQDITKMKLFEEQLKEAHADLEDKNEHLQDTLKELKQTQAQLIQSEKLGALGQLVAGIAHEINTPLGAINASAYNMQDSLQKLKDDIKYTLNEFSANDIELYNELISSLGNDNEYLSSKEKRVKKKMLIAQLEECHPENSREIAELLVYFNLDSLTEEMKQNTNLLSICIAVKNYISLIRNIANIILATDKTSKVVYALKNYIHKTHDGRKEPVNLEESIETILILNANKTKRGITVTRNYESVPAINAHGDELGHIWNNLISNAIHAMNEKGNLTIGIRANNGGKVSVTISDDGCGIPEEHRERIFEPFYTSKNAGEGTGMGLDIAKKIVDKHHGTITFETEVGKGTSFTVVLPVN